MIRLKRSLLSLFSFIAILVLGLYVSTGSSALLRAEDVPDRTGRERIYVSERMGIPAVQVNGNLATSYITNGYYDAQVNVENTIRVHKVYLESEIENFEIANVESAEIIIKVSQAGSVNTPLNWNTHTFKARYNNVFYSGTNTGTYNESGYRPIFEVAIPYDYELLNSQEFKLWLTTTGGISPVETQGTVRIHSITIKVVYHFDIDDPISPIVDGAGALVESVNLAEPNLSGKTLVDTDTYRLVSSNGINVDYHTKTGNIRVHGTVTNNNPSTIYYLTAVSMSLDFAKTYSVSHNLVSTGASNQVPFIQKYFNFRQVVDATFNGSGVTVGNTSHGFRVDINDLALGTVFDITFKVQVELTTSPSTWMHPDAKYYSMASIQHDQNLDSTDTIMSNVYAFDDVDGNISDRLTVVRTPRDYAAALANAWGIRINDALAAYDDETLSIPITSTITFDNAYVDAQFLIYQETTFWYKYDNDLIEPLGTSQSYPFMAYVGDNAGNYTFLEIKVFVNDATAPVFDAANAINTTVSYKTTLDLNVWKETLIITDNVDDYVERTIYQDNYTANKAVPGTYVVTVRATDEAGNTKDKNYNIIVVDDIKPVFNGPESIYKPQSSSMTIQDILNRYTAFDEISGNVTSRIYVHQDNYTGRGHIANTYTVILRVSDLANNVEYFTIYITVTDDIPPVIYVADGYFIQVSAAYTLTIEGIRDILVATGRLNIVSATTWSVLVNEYQGNENTPGIYTVSIRFQQTSGVTEVHSVAIGVKNASSTPGGTFEPESSNGYIYIGVGIAVIGFIVILKKRK